jgi:hypothetical protein
MLRIALDGDAARSNGEPVRVALAIRGGAVVSADVSGRGATEQMSINDTSFGRERLLAEVAARLPADASKPPNEALPAPAERAFADAGTLLAGAANVETIERAVKLLESTLSAAPGHSGALRAYARSQRMLALLGRDPASARDRRLLARDALRRAVVADRVRPQSPRMSRITCSGASGMRRRRRNGTRWRGARRPRTPRSCAISPGLHWPTTASAMRWRR